MRVGYTGDAGHEVSDLLAGLHVGVIEGLAMLVDQGDPGQTVLLAGLDELAIYCYKVTLAFGFFCAALTLGEELFPVRAHLHCFFLFLFDAFRFILLFCLYFNTGSQWLQFNLICMLNWTLDLGLGIFTLWKIVINLHLLEIPRVLPHILEQLAIQAHLLVKIDCHWADIVDMWGCLLDVLDCLALELVVLVREGGVELDPLAGLELELGFVVPQHYTFTILIYYKLQSSSVCRGLP